MSRKYRIPSSIQRGEARREGEHDQIGHGQFKGRTNSSKKTRIGAVIGLARKWEGGIILDGIQRMDVYTVQYSTASMAFTRLAFFLFGAAVGTAMQTVSEASLLPGTRAGLFPFFSPHRLLLIE